MTCSRTARTVPTKSERLPPPSLTLLTEVEANLLTGTIPDDLWSDAMAHDLPGDLRERLIIHHWNRAASVLRALLHSKSTRPGRAETQRALMDLLARQLPDSGLLAEIIISGLLSGLQSRRRRAAVRTLLESTLAPLKTRTEPDLGSFQVKLIDWFGGKTDPETLQADFDLTERILGSCAATLPPQTPRVRARLADMLKRSFAPGFQTLPELETRLARLIGRVTHSPASGESP